MEGARRTSGGLMALLALLGARAVYCREAPGDFVMEAKSECHFLNGSQRVRYLDRRSYNREQFVHFDSDVGLYVADTELGEAVAKQANNNKELIEQMRTAANWLCRHNYGLFEDFMQHRRLKPSVNVYASKTEDPNKPHRLTCNVNGFYPYGITVRWFKNGQEDPGVVSSELLQNGDWTAQIMVLLSTTIEHGDSFICEVEHISLEQPIRKEWRLEASESTRSKMVMGFVSLALGVILLAIGIVYYRKNRNGAHQFINPEAEEANFM